MATHTVILSAWWNRTFCLLTTPSKRKCASSENCTDHLDIPRCAAALLVDLLECRCDSTDVPQTTHRWRLVTFALQHWTINIKQVIKFISHTPLHGLSQNKEYIKTIIRPNYVHTCLNVCMCLFAGNIVLFHSTFFNRVCVLLTCCTVWGSADEPWGGKICWACCTQPLLCLDCILFGFKRETWAPGWACGISRRTLPTAFVRPSRKTCKNGSL
jgi:hypothetical protein